MSDEIDPMTEQAEERLEDGFQSACGHLTIDIAEVRKSIDDEEVKQMLKQAEYCLDKARKNWGRKYD